MTIRLVVAAVAAAVLLSACGEPEYWEIHRASGPGADVILKAGVANAFWLEPVKKSGKIVYYKVGFDAGKMTDHWKGVILHPRGSAAYPWSGDKLAAWDPTLTGPAMVIQKTTYVTAIDAAFSSRPLNTSHERLEGDVIVNGVAEALTLIFIKDAITGGTRLLLVNLKDDRPGQPIQSGSASGDPR